MASANGVAGDVEPGWGPVADAFAANFDERGEIGAACCVYRESQPVVDIWAGLADPSTGRSWDPPDSLGGRALTGPADLFAYDEMWNDRAVHAAEMPSSNGIGSAEHETGRRHRPPRRLARRGRRPARSGDRSGRAGGTEMRVGRVQATIFLPGAVADAVDERRRRWDPSGAWRIAPHVTVLHHAESASALQTRLTQIAPALSPFRLRIGKAERWPAPDLGIYVAVDDVDHGLSRLRNLLATASGRAPRTGYIPHVTIAHPRRVQRAEVEHAWGDLWDWTIDQTITIDTVSVVESTSSAWETIGSSRLGIHDPDLT